MHCICKIIECVCSMEEITQALTNNFTSQFPKLVKKGSGLVSSHIKIYLMVTTSTSFVGIWNGIPAFLGSFQPRQIRNTSGKTGCILLMGPYLFLDNKCLTFHAGRRCFGRREYILLWIGSAPRVIAGTDAEFVGHLLRQTRHFMRCVSTRIHYYKPGQVK